jgi:hypothetical protein
MGSTSFATGWYQGLRQFNKKSFIKSKPGGSVPRVRYSSGPLLNSVFLSELDQIRDAGFLDQVLSGIELDGILADDSDKWTQRISEHAHWQTLSKLDSEIPKAFSKRLAELESQIDSALSLYFKLSEAGIVLSNNTGPSHLEGWQEALTKFKSLIGKT